MSTTDITATNPRDVYRKVTDAIINAIEQGVGNWRMPWHITGRFAFSPINVASRKPYRGINTVCLWAAYHARILPDSPGPEFRWTVLWEHLREKMFL